MKNKQVYSLGNVWRFQKKQKQNKTPYFSKHIERKFRRAAEKCKFRSASQSTNFASSSTVESPDFSVEFGISLDKDARARMRYYYVKG
jgi:hypothetical protein